MEVRSYTTDEIIQIIRDRMYTMDNGRQPREGCNAKFYDLIYFFKYGHDDPDGHFSEIAPDPSLTNQQLNNKQNG